MKKCIWTAVVSVGILLMVLTFQPSEVLSQTKTFTLKFSDPSPAGQPRSKGYVEWADWLAKKTNGRVRGRGFKGGVKVVTFIIPPFFVPIFSLNPIFSNFILSLFVIHVWRCNDARGSRKLAISLSNSGTCW
jgi:hypothetical protein